MKVLPTCLRPLSLALFAGGLVTTAPAAARSIDCHDTLVPVEHTICSTPTLRALDARIARDYARLRTTMDANAADALRDDQRWFLKARDRAVEGLRGSDLITELTDRYTARAAFLNAVAPRPAAGIVGTWANAAGRITLVLTKSGYTLNGASTEPALQAWSCEIAMKGRGDVRDRAVFFTLPAPGLDGWMIVTARKAAMLWVDEQPVDLKAHVRPYCGANGMMGGAYFRIKATN